MKNLLYLWVFLCSIGMFSQATSYKITGQIRSEKDQSLLESATIHLEKTKDSSVVSYTISNEKGLFTLEGKTFEKKLKLYISFIGLKTFSKKIIIDGKPADLGRILMRAEENILDEVVIKSRAPITIKKDTLEFNVKSFKTKKDASVEDLLKKLPGVEVDEQGKITVNGKPVNKILVNGKPFFGNDPTIATKNLTKEIIEKVQITDTKSKSEAFTGQKGDQNNKTINLTIKEENNKGWFGRLAAGSGSDKHYEYAALINRFNNNKRISFLAGGNDINSPGFSFGEIQKMFGGGNSISFNSNGSFSVDGRSFGMGQGVVKSKNTGITLADKIGKKVDVNVDYFHSGSNSENESTRNRENILPNGNYFSNSTSVSNNENNNHTINSEFDIKIDSTLLINLSPSFTFNDRNGQFNNHEETLDSNRNLTNKSTVKNTTKSSDKNFKNNMDVTKKFGKKGAFIKVSLEHQIDKSESDDYSVSEINIINSSTENRNQYIDGKVDFTKFQTRLSYRQPLADKLYLNFKYTYTEDERESIKSTFDFDNNSQQYSNFNKTLSTNFVYKSIKKTPGVELSYRGKKWSTRFGAGYVVRNIESQDYLRPNLNLKRDFEAMELNSNFSYRFANKASIYAGYNLNNNVPSIHQLQPFTNETNPLNIITGNPNLKPTNRHRYHMNFNKYNFQKGTGFFIYTSINTTNNQVVSKSNVDPTTLVRNTTYENVNGNYNFQFFGNYNKKIKLDTIRSLKIRLGASYNIRKNINFFNNIKYSSKTTSISPNIGITLGWKKIFEIAPRYTISFSESTFDLANFSAQKFIRHSLAIKTKTLSTKKLEWRNDIRYSYNPDVIDSFDRSAWFWNSTLNYSVLKDKGTISLKAYDLLNQNTNVRRRATENYIEDSQSTVLKQYFMLSFSWKFNSLGKKGNTNSSMNFIEF